MGAITEYEIIPENLSICVRFLNFKKYVLSEEGLYETVIIPDKKIPKCGYHDRLFILDDPSQIFFKEYYSEDSIVKVVGDNYLVSEKKFTKESDTLIQPLKEWFESPKAITDYNTAQMNAIWNQFASGTESSWSMQSLTYYDREHELENINENKYSIVNYFDLPETPEVYDNYYRFIAGEQKKFDKYKILRIAGTVLKSDSTHHTIALLTKYGVVSVKFSKGQHSFYDKRISKIEENGKKKIVEESWFKRGTLLAVVGTRIEDSFKAMNYTDSIFKHTCERILEIHEDGTLLLQTERTKV